MGFLRSIAAKAAAPWPAGRKPAPSASPGPLAATTKSVGDQAEELALQHLLRHGLLLVMRNFKTPGRGGGEVDLIMREADGTLVFVEVRRRATASHGGAAGSITATKQRRIVYAAQHYISRLPRTPPCRFDVVTVQGATHDVQVQWLRAAFDAS